MKKLIVFLLLSFSFGCAHHHSVKHESNVAITDTLKGNRFANIYFSGQPSGKDLKALKEKGFVTVINLRGKKEGAYVEEWEQKVVTDQGLHYYNLPFSMQNEMTDEYIDSVTSKVMQHRKDGNILIHCSSGNRVGVWLGSHFHKDHGFDKVKSLKLAKELGLNMPKAQAKLQSYLDKH